MNDSNNSEINLKMGNCEIRVRGAESFVERKFQELVDSYWPLSGTFQLTTTGENGNPGLVSTNKSELAVLYSVDNDSGKVSIHGKVPGLSKSERMKNVALIVLYGMRPTEPIANTAIREACIEQACLDSSNFATTIKKDKQNFIVSGKGSEWSAKLTVFGVKKAEAILKEMLNEQSGD